MTNWNYRHIADQRVRQVENSVLLSTYEQRYSVPKPKFSRLQKQLMSLLVCFACLYLLLEIGVFDPIFELVR